MIDKTIKIKKKKRLSKGQRTHVRRREARSRQDRSDSQVADLYLTHHIQGRTEHRPGC